MRGPRWGFLLSTILVSCVAEHTANSTTYTALYQPHSNSTPIFRNSGILQALASSNGSLCRRATSSLPVGACAPGTPCTNGACCSNTGVCSYAPSSCSPSTCISNCNAQAPCGQYADPASATCPLNVCCSQFGFCDYLLLLEGVLAYGYRWINR
jgi:chitinase